MNNNILQFKTNLFDSIFNVAFKIWGKVSVVYLLQLTLSSILIFPIIYYIIGIDAKLLLSIATQETDYNVIVNKIGSLFIENVSIPRVILGSLLVLFISIIISAWSYNTYFITAEQYVYTGKTSLGHALKNSLNSDILKIIGLVSYLFMMTFFLFSIITPVSIRIGFLGLLLFFAFMVMMIRFIISIPSIIIGKMGVIESLQFSWRNITFIRALKITGIGFATFLALILIILVVQLFSLPLSFLGIPGTILSQLLSIAIQGFFGAFIVSSLIGLYFRYTDFEGGSFQEHDYKNPIDQIENQLNNNN